MGDALPHPPSGCHRLISIQLFKDQKIIKMNLNVLGGGERVKSLFISIIKFSILKIFNFHSFKKRPKHQSDISQTV